MTTYREFIDGLIADVGLLPPLDLPIADAIGCVIVDDVEAPAPIPAYREVRIEGYAVRSVDLTQSRADAPVSLDLVDAITSGKVAESVLQPGQTIRVSPGAALPEGADSVAGSTLIVDRGDKVQVMGPVPAGKGFQPEGRTFAAGDLVARSGQRLTHTVMGALAVCGFARVRVHPRPRVVVLTIGSDLVGVDTPGEPGHVHDAAGVLLATTARGLGADAYRVGPVPDDERLVRNAVEDQLVRADLLVTVGGIDGPDDILRRNLDNGEAATFDGPVLDPCPAYGAGLIGPDGTPIIALPADPAAALLAFHAIVRPVIEAMRGLRPEATSAPGGTAAAVAPGTGARLVPGHVGSDGRFTPIEVESPTLRELIPANAMVVVDPAAEHPAAVLLWPT